MNRCAPGRPTSPAGPTGRRGRLASCVLWTFVAGWPLSTPAQVVTSHTDVDRLTTLATGHFDNHQQVDEQRGAAAAFRWPRVRLVVERADMPVLGPRVLSVWRQGNGEADARRGRRFYRVVADPAAGGVRFDAFGPAGSPGHKDEGRGVPGTLAPRAERLMRLPECDVSWRREESAFVGTVSSGGCSVSWTGLTELDRASEWTVSDRGWAMTVHRAETATSAAGDDVSLLLLRAREFVCWTVLRKEGTDDDYEVARGLSVYDQGDRVVIGSAGAPAQTYSFDLAQLRYAGALPVLRLAVFGEDQERALTYAWTDADGGRIGINLRWLQVGCTRATAGEAGRRP